MEKKLGVKDIRRATGLTGAEIAWFHHQGVVRAAGFSTYSVNDYDGYKYYNPEDMLRFQQISMYYELGLRRNEIRDIMLEPDYDFDSSLDDLYQRLKEKRERIERHMIAIEQIRMFGTSRKVMDCLCGISLEKLGATYQVLQASDAWAEMQKNFQQTISDDVEERISKAVQIFTDLDETALQEGVGDSAIQQIVREITEDLGLAGYMVLLTLVMGILEEGESAELSIELLGTKLSETQAQVIRSYIKKDVEQFLREILDVIVQYHIFFGNESCHEQIGTMVNDVKRLMKEHFGICREAEYRLIFELLPPPPPADNSDYLGYIYNAMYFYHNALTVTRINR